MQTKFLRLPELNTARLFQAVLWCALFALALRNIVDGDFWWHLSTGEYILHTGTIPHQDVFSDTRLGQSWIAHEWLSEVIIAGIFNWGGFGALIVIFAGIIATAFFLAFRVGRGNVYLGAVVTLIGAFSSYVVWDVRPQMLALLLTSVTLWLLARYRENENTRAVWFLLPLMLAWVNLHGSFLLLPVLIGIYLGGGGVERYWRNPSAPPLSTRGLARLALLLLLTLAIIPVNPNGVRMYTYALETLNDPLMQAHITEWQSPDFHSPAMLPLAILILAMLGGLALAARRLSVTQVLLLTATLFEALRAVRFVPLFALVAIPILSELTPMPWRASSRAKNLVGLNWLLLGAMLAAVAGYAGSVAQKQSHVEQSSYPVRAVEYLERENLSAPMFNLYEWGGYLIWKLYPTHRVFVDGRADVYGALLEDYLAAYRAAPNAQTILEQYHIGVVVLPPNAPLIHLLAAESNWREAYRDEQAVIWVRR